jgi:DNA-binding NarL/FixJ family response regulator
VIRVLVADDQSLIRSAVCALLAMEDDIEVIGEVETGTDAIELAGRLEPDVVVMDVRMPHGDGIWATEQIIKNAVLGRTRILVLTTFEDDENIFNALHAGASGFLGKGTDGPSLVQAVRAVALGESLLSPSATKKVIEKYLKSGNKPSRPIRKPSELSDLTERELEILKLVGLGLNNNAISTKLFISPLTVKTHISKLMGKLGVHDRAQLVIEAYESGLVKPGEPDNPSET